MSANTCTVTLCDTQAWCSVKRQRGCVCVSNTDCRSVAVYGEVLLWIIEREREKKNKRKERKAQCTVHSSPDRNSTHFRGFHHKSSSNNHSVSSVFSKSEVLFFWQCVVALHLYRYCLDPKEKRRKKKKKIFSCVDFSCQIIGRTLFMFHQ